jgi:hypothetical protein
MNTRILFLFVLSLAFAACGNSTEAGPAVNTAGDAKEVQATTDSENPSAKGRYKTGDNLYVYARSGLTLREKPQIDGAKLTSLPFGTKVNVIDDDLESDPFSAKEPCGLEISGHWVKVKHGQKEGYLFDGFLLTHGPDAVQEPVTYWTSVSKVKSTSDKGPHADVEYYEYASTVWENGVSYVSQGYVGGSSSTLILPKSLVSFQEAYLMAMAMLQNDPANPMKCSCDLDKEELQCDSKDQMLATALRVDDQGNWEILDSVAD